jgi:hypothetical protein
MITICDNRALMITIGDVRKIITIGDNMTDDTNLIRAHMHVIWGVYDHLGYQSVGGVRRTRCSNKANQRIRPDLLKTDCVNYSIVILSFMMQNTGIHFTYFRCINPVELSFRTDMPLNIGLLFSYDLYCAHFRAA